MHYDKLQNQTWNTQSNQSRQVGEQARYSSAFRRIFVPERNLNTLTIP